jgi:integrase
MSVRSTTHRGKPVWMVQVIRDRGAYNRRRFLDRRTHRRQDALDVEAELIAEYEAGRLGDYSASPTTVDLASATTPPAIPTLAEFAERYLALQDPSRSDYQNKARYLRMHLLPHLGALRLDQITAMVIDALKVKLRAPSIHTSSAAAPRSRRAAPVSARRRGAPRSPKTINNILATLRTLLHLAHDYELVDRVPRIRMEKVPQVDPVFLGDDEVARLLAATPDAWRLILLTAVRTGLRCGELLALRWEDVHLDADRPVIRVARSLRREPDGTFRTKEPKGGRPRTVPLTRDLTEALRARRAIRDSETVLVFPGPTQGFLDHHRIWTITVAAARRAGLDKHVHPHLLRHTFASRCYREGIPPQIVQLWLGHAHITTTERYAHLAPDAGADFIDRLG